MALACIVKTHIVLPEYKNMNDPMESSQSELGSCAQRLFLNSAFWCLGSCPSPGIPVGLPELPVL